MKRILVPIKENSSINAIQREKEEALSKIIPHKKAYPIREKPDVIKTGDDTEIGLPSGL